MRLRTLTDVFAYAQAEGIELRLDATEIQVRRPPAGRGGRRAIVSGKKKQNTMKATVIADHQGRTLWADALRPGRMHDATAARNEGIAVCFQHFPAVEVLLDDGYLGLRRDHPGQAVTPPGSRTRSPSRTCTQPEKKPGTDTHQAYASPPSTLRDDHSGGSGFCQAVQGSGAAGGAASRSLPRVAHSPQGTGGVFRTRRERRMKPGAVPCTSPLLPPTVSRRRDAHPHPEEPP
ncbi:hypothetical protein GCM10010299_13930 [Streptomyces tanashiensis]|nr:hypothetical protein GCM10010299_13930 [Streptomyces tanashiensis]